MSVQVDKRAPFVVQHVDALVHLRKSWDPPVNVRRRIGLLIYFALTELAAEQGAVRFAATRHEIAVRADIADRTADHAIDELVRLGLVQVEAGRHGSRFRPNAYTLLDLDAEAVAA